MRLRSRPGNIRQQEYQPGTDGQPIEEVATAAVRVVPGTYVQAG
jgi:hypothetical protein